MYMIFLRDRWAIDGAKDRNDPERYTTIFEGRHEFERVPNPYGYHGEWLVLKGTMIGATEESWRQWVRTPNANLKVSDDLEVFIEE